VAFQLRAWRWPLLLFWLVLGAYWAVSAWRAGTPAAAQLIERLPAEARTVVYVDAGRLRQSGLLGRLMRGQKDSEYRRFVQVSAFDFERDLEVLVLGYGAETTYALAAGRFQQEALQRYAESQQGRCEAGVCRVPAARGMLSWRAVNKQVLALASGPEATAVDELLRTGGAREWQAPDAPVWMASSGAALRAMERQPEGTRLFTRILEPAATVTLALSAAAPAGNDDGLSITLAAECGQAEVAARVAKELTDLTAALNAMLAREKQRANEADLSGVLTGGRFAAQGAKVGGAWPLPRPFVEALLAGGR
jgi:hypothetical protein